MLGDPPWRPFDYVEDGHGRLHAVRAMAGGGRAIVRPTYRRVDGVPRKIDRPAPLPGHALEPADALLSLFDAECVCLPTQGLRRVCEARGAAAGAVAAPAHLSAILERLRASGARVFAYGSQALGVATPASDWDFLVEGPIDLIEPLLALRERHGLRLLDAAAIESLAARYRYPASVVAPHDLAAVLRAGMPFFFAGDAQVDLFGVAAQDVPCPPAVAREPGLRVAGVIEANGGDSFLMPRRVMVRDGARRVAVSHYAWLLCGMERLHGRGVVFSNLLRDAAGGCWFSPRESRLELVDHASLL